MKIVGFIALLIALFVSLFHIGGADLTDKTLALALMVLLAMLFSDLKEFDFWGLRGVQKEKEKIEKLKDKKSIVAKNPSKKTQAKVRKAEYDYVIQLMDTPRGNLVALTVEIERMLALVAQALAGEDLPERPSIAHIRNLLREKKFLTTAGNDQVTLLESLKTKILNGSDTTIPAGGIDDGVELALGVYSELKDKLTPKNTP